MNQNSFSKRIGQKPQTTGKIIKGKNKPSYDYIVSILSTFVDISADWLIMGKEPRAQPLSNPDPYQEIMNLQRKSIEHLETIDRLKETILSLKQQLAEKHTAEQAELKKEVQDVRAELRELKALFYNEEDFNKAIDFLNRPPSDLSVCLTGLDGKLNFINEQFTQQTGYTEKDVLGKKPGKVLQRDNTDQPAIGQIRRALRDRKYFEGEIINYNKTGNKIICKLIIAPAKGKPGKLENFISLAVFSKVNVTKYVNSTPSDNEKNSTKGKHEVH